MTQPRASRLSTRPERLRKGDIVTVFSPSSSVPSFFPERLDRAERELERLGFRVRRGAHVTDRTGYTAGFPEQRAAEINEAFANRQVSAILCSIGGNNSNQLLDQIDYDTIRRNPKVLVGYSDATALLVAVWQTTGLVTYHGPGVLPEFGEFPGVMSFTERSFLETICEALSPRKLSPPDSWTDEYAEWADPENWTRTRPQTPNALWRAVRSGVGEGPLVGGNLETLLKLAGTPFWPDLNGAILFWEEARQPAAQVDAHLTQLRQIGVFSQIAGMMIGRPYHCDASVGIGFAEVIDEKLSSVPFPVLADVDFGHTDPMLTLPIGIRTRLVVGDAECEVTVLEPAVA
jgi:muramoyltetrapeptide carboxypeptidase